MNKNLDQRARELLERIKYITIATVSQDGQPWNSPVVAVSDENYNFYWMSWQENQHSRNIAQNTKIFLVIYDSTAPEGAGEGVYIQATAEKLENADEIEKALQYFTLKLGKPVRKAEKFLGSYPRRIYKAMPLKIWMNTKGDVEGNYVDTRTEITLKKL